MWNVGTIGFDTYHYKYDSGREGDSQTIGFYPRKGKITVYLMDSKFTPKSFRFGETHFSDKLLAEFVCTLNGSMI